MHMSVPMPFWQQNEGGINAGWYISRALIGGFFLFFFERRCLFEKKESRPSAREGGPVWEGASLYLGENKSPKQNTLFRYREFLERSRSR
jgi:hypothetical protein